MTLRNIILGAASLALFATAMPALMPAMAQAPSDALKAAVAGSHRSASNVARDGARHPAAALTFFGLGPHMRVIEVAPGGGYWTEILAPYAKATAGTYVAAQGKPDQKLPEKFSNEAVYGKINYTVFSNTSGPMGPAASADFVLTSRNIHDWLWTPGMAEKFMRDAFAVLKPGGILAVTDHRADPRPQHGDARDGYVATSTIVNMAKAAGFKLEASSEINANAKDTKDHPFGVWTLPPVRRSAPSGQPADPKFDHGKYDAIGESDRMTLRFSKPV
ncbi:MAG: class I SAM-dependent methyltransferase [Alphaproteobacteria bacterium]|nr:class I SAM-dependent methyltransferase [Alphaproteobacteria bacterium]